MTVSLKILTLCLLLVTATSCYRFRGPCSLWPMLDPSGGTPMTEPFLSTEGRFRIGLPGPGRVPESDDKTFKWFIINAGQYLIFYRDRETAVDTPENSQVILDKLREYASSRGKVTAESEISVSGHPGREFRIDTGGGTEIDRIYLAGNRIYFVTVFVPRSLDCKVGAAVRVLDTFEILDDSQR